MQPNLYKVNLQNCQQISNNTLNYVIPGLARGTYGFIIGTPNVGKGFFSISLAYEIATGIPILGLTEEGSPKKVLYWPAEDMKFIAFERMQRHLANFNETTLDLIESNFTVFDSSTPICFPQADYFNQDVAADINKNMNDLIDIAKDFDVVIIDTIREAVGWCHEVKQDFEIKMALQTLARRADVGVIATHHPTKEISQKKTEVTSVAGSGLSMTQANCRYTLYVDKDKKKRTFVSHIKHNNTPRKFVFDNEPLYWNDAGLIYQDVEAVSRMCFGNVPKEVSVEVKKELVPREVVLTDEILSKTKTSPISKAKTTQRRLKKNVKLNDDYENFLNSNKET